MATVQNRLTTVMGAVLAGGNSRRMGQDKALLTLSGHSLLVRAVAVLGSVVDEVVVVAPQDRGYARLGVEIVPDVRPGLGPVGGIHAALVRGGGRPVFILACDMPYVSGELVRWIIGPSGENPMTRIAGQTTATTQVRVVHDGERFQPLCGLYSYDCLAKVEQALTENRCSGQALLDSLDTESLTLDHRQSWDHPDLLLNVNEMESFAELAASLGSDR